MLPATATPAHGPGRRRLTPGFIAMFAAVVLVVGCGSSADESGADAPTTAARSTTTVGSGSTAAPAQGAAGPTVVKEILGTEVNPPGADGHTLTLIRYTIPAGAKLAPHIHPGVQMARISAGELTYTVVEGTAIVRRKGADEDEELTAPGETKLVAGDTVTELDGMVHFGANDTGEDVIIDATLLTEDGQDLAVPVTTPGSASTTTS